MDDMFDLARLEASQQKLYDGQYAKPMTPKSQSISPRSGRPLNIPWAAKPVNTLVPASQPVGTRTKKRDTRTAFIDGPGWKRSWHPPPTKKHIIVISDDEDDRMIKPKKLKTAPESVTRSEATSSFESATKSEPSTSLVKHVPMLNTPPESRPASSLPVDLTEDIPSSQSSVSSTSTVFDAYRCTPGPSLPQQDLSPNVVDSDLVSISSDSQSVISESRSVAASSQGSQSVFALSQSPSDTGLVDHTGKRLSKVAVAVATEYWNCFREAEVVPENDERFQGPRAMLHPRMRIFEHRRTYTKIILGVTELPPNARTYEPPYIPPEGILPGSPNQAAPNNNPEPPQDDHAVANAIQEFSVEEEPPAEGPVVEPALNNEQLRVVELAARGSNIFYTGSAGCGKSAVLNAIRKRLEDMGKTVHVMAPTGKVALAINGTTTWMYAGWSPDTYKRKLSLLEGYAQGKNSACRRRFRQTDVIIIDEISMVENQHFERLNAVMKVGRRAMPSKTGKKGAEAQVEEKPFGGVQVIVTGDFCQLPPVKPFGTCMYCGFEFHIDNDGAETKYNCHNCHISYKDSDKWAFRSKAWEECKFVHVLLKSIHRQNDAQFIRLLQNCRMGIPFTKAELDLLMNHKSYTKNAVKLFSTREEVRRTNEEAFRRLKSPPRTYKCLDKFIWRRQNHPNLITKGDKFPDGTLKALKDHRLDREIQLKIGTLVVLLVNLDLSQGFCNGSQGIIIGFEPYDPEKLPRKCDPARKDSDASTAAYAGIKYRHLLEFSEQQTGDVGWPIVRFHNGQIRTIYPECQVNEVGDTKAYSLLCRTQVPLTAAWALSIHRAQGMTLNNVIVDLSRAFEEGQVYVALSRAKTLRGLKVEGDPKGLLVSKGRNLAVAEFLREKFGI